MINNKSLSDSLIYHRKLKGFTQEILSEKTRVTVRTIQRIEKGEVNPHLQTVKLLAAALEIEVDDLLVLHSPKHEAVKKKWFIIMHGAPVLGVIFPLANIIISLLIWVHKRDDNVEYDRHGRDVVNFHITMTLVYALSIISLVTIEGYGFFFFIFLLPFIFLVILINIITVANNQKYYYPLSIPFLKKSRSETIKLIVFFVFCSLPFLGGCQHNSTDYIIKLDGSTIKKAELTKHIEQLVSSAKVHGIGVAVLDQNEITFQKTFGYKNFKTKDKLTIETNMYGASLSKAVFAVLVLKLVEEKIIDLDKPLESYLSKRIFEYQPKAKWHDNYLDLKDDSLYSKITARMCLSHTTGFPNWRWFESDHKLKVKFEPGSEYSYSGEGFVYLQVVMEKILGKGLEEIAQEKLFRPLGMINSSYQWNDNFENDFAHGHNIKGELYKKDKDNEPRSGSTLETSLSDYSKFIRAVLNQKIISSASWEELLKTQIRIRSKKQFGADSKIVSTANNSIKLGYGLGWGVLQSPYGVGAFKEGHGDGFQHYTIIFPEAEIGIILLSNSDNGESIFKELLEIAIGDTYTPWEWENYIPYNE